MLLSLFLARAFKRIKRFGFKNCHKIMWEKLLILETGKNSYCIEAVCISVEYFLTPTNMPSAISFI